jgi:[NiFe] hydrogenase diaphorase moiety small subunit
LQALAYFCGMLEPGFNHFYPQRPVDASHPDAIIDFNRCILCELCVRASRDADGKSVFALTGRGMQTQLSINSPTGLLGDSTFAATDKAAHICPVGAILPKGRGYAVPVGARLYDRKPINLVGDRADHQHDDSSS